MGLVRNNQDPLQPPLHQPPRPPPTATPPSPSSPSPSVTLSAPHTLEPLPLYDPNAICSVCELRSSGAMFTCKSCNLTLLHQSCAELHQACARLPKSYHHPSHAGSCNLPLSLASCNYPGGQFFCNGCRLLGDRWAYHCDTCNYDLHVRCAVRPHRVRHRAHASCELTLIFKAPYPNSVGFICDVCGQFELKDPWRYRCHKFDFDVHMDCAV